jgi:hypothetical protein
MDVTSRKHPHGSVAPLASKSLANLAKERQLTCRGLLAWAAPLP